MALINGGAHLDFRNKKGHTAVHVATLKGNVKVLEVCDGAHYTKAKQVLICKNIIFITVFGGLAKNFEASILKHL